MTYLFPFLEVLAAASIEPTKPGEFHVIAVLQRPATCIRELVRDLDRITNRVHLQMTELRTHQIHLD